MKKIILLLLIVVLCVPLYANTSFVDISLSSEPGSASAVGLLKEPAYAVSQGMGLESFFAELLKDPAYVARQEKRLDEEAGITPEDRRRFSDWLQNCREQDYIEVIDGKLTVLPKAEEITPAGKWEEYGKRVQAINEGIELGIYSYDLENGLQLHTAEWMENSSCTKEVPAE